MKMYVGTGCLLILLGSLAGSSSVPAFQRQVIKIPSELPFTYAWGYSCEDIDADGLRDLVATSPSGRVFIFRQGRSGFPSEPSQIIDFPERTAWFMLADVSGNQNPEIVVSTGDGLAYYHQEDGEFESEPEMLIEAPQIFGGETIGYITNLGRSGTCWLNEPPNRLPVILSDRVVAYECNESDVYRPSAITELELESSMIKVEDTGWRFGQEQASGIMILTKARERRSIIGQPQSDELSGYIKKMIEKIDRQRFQGYCIVRNDINGDGRQDVTLVQLIQSTDLKTTIVIFLRHDNGRLSEKPDWIVRCRGIPAQGEYPNPPYFTPFADINNDGFPDIVLLELKQTFMSIEGLLEMALSKGLDWRLTVRLFRKSKGYPRRPDFKMNVTTMLPIFEHVGALAFVDGDFNADGRPDVMITRTPTERDIYLSRGGTGFFQPTPKIHLDVPAGGTTSIVDLNGDGISDVYLVDHEKGEITVFLSKPAGEGATSE